MQIYRPQFVFYAVIILLWLIGTPLHAALNIEIFGGGATQIPIAIAPFSSEEKLKQSLLTKDENGIVKVNFDPSLIRLLREVKYFK